MRHNVADESGVRVMAERCSTCIFRPGNLMHLQPGRLREMVERVREIEGVIPCHETLGDDLHAVCRGQFEEVKTQWLQLAERLDYIVPHTR